MQCDPKEYKSRINKISGQIHALETMYEERRSASDILQQVVAVRASLSSLARIIAEAEARGCLSKDGSVESMSRLIETIFKVT